MRTDEAEKRPTYVTCPCDHCNGNIEFDANELAEENRIMPCPHCGLETKLFIPQTTADRELAAPVAKSASAVGHLKIACPSCGKRIEFPREQLGQVIDCPGCGLSVALNVAGINLGATTKTESPSLPPIPPVSQQPVRAEARSLRAWKVIGCGFLGFIGLSVILLIMVVISDGSNSGGSASKEPNPTDPATQQKLADAVAGYEALGVFNKIQVYPGDQVWVYVSDSFSKLLTIDDKHRAIAIVYSVYHNKDSVKFVVLKDTYTGKNVGMYDPSYGLKLD